MVSFDDHFKVANFEFVILMPVLYKNIVRMILEILLNFSHLYQIQNSSGLGRLGAIRVLQLLQR